MAKKIGVIMSGCGKNDGGEIHETVCTLLALADAGAEAVNMAPDIPQRKVMNHLTSKQQEGETRNVLIESARIARGDIADITDVNADELDGLIVPGGFGAALNLSNFAIAGDMCEVNTEVEMMIRKVHDAGKPVGFICIAPAIAAKVLGDKGVKLTIGNDTGTASILEKMGARHVNCPVDDCVIDENLKVVTTPAYMLGPSIADINKGISKLVGAVLEMA